MQIKGVKVVMIGGGTGSFTLLSALKDYVHNITAIVNMVDDGGSTGVLRDELGVLPPGDVRQCLVALSRSSEQMRQLFNYRFPEGTFEGHSFGNLFLTALEKTTGSFGEAVKTAGEVLNIVGQVLPVTLDDAQLVLEGNGREIRGEFEIAGAKFKYPRLRLDPIATITPEAEGAIKEADMVVFAPGNLYGSLIPTLLVNGMAAALQASKAKCVYVCNLATKSGQTDDFKVHDYVQELERFGGKGMLDCVLYNNQKPPPLLLETYAKEGEYWVEYDEVVFAQASYKAIGEGLVSSTIHTQDPHDTRVQRTLIRHDGDAVARLLMRLYFT